ncbi:hypothetical protein GBAR_LOCUS9355 [Geodia barretti]|uniref:Uncharacterized protein n=1 Tax=Geodia barretti TaxID=519541 RepID=A0AA35WII2_GEOBA|nr:hypothetical protein GBAR_LOCUS9355 [Geodia barretti]
MESPTPPPPAAEAGQPQGRNGGGNSSCKPLWVDAELSVYVGNLDPDTSVEDMEELLYELFLQTITEMASNSVDDSTVLPHTTDGTTDATDGGSGADRNGSQIELERQSQSGSGLFSGVSDNKRNPFTDNSVVPHPSDDQMCSVVVDLQDQTGGDNGMAPYRSDDQMSSGMALSGDQTGSGMAPYSSGNQMTSGVVHFSDDEQPDNGMAPHTSDDQIRNGLVLFRNDSYFDDDSQYHDDSGYVSSTLLRKHARFETDADEDDHDEPYRDGPSHPPPEVPLDYHTELQPFGQPPTKLHRSRLSSRDHLSRETRRNTMYHRSRLQRLQDTIGQLKEAIIVEKSNSPLHSTTSTHQ